MDLIYHSVSQLIKDYFIFKMSEHGQKSLLLFYAIEGEREARRDLKRCTWSREGNQKDTQNYHEHDDNRKQSEGKRLQTDTKHQKVGSCYIRAQ